MQPSFDPPSIPPYDKGGRPRPPQPCKRFFLLVALAVLASVLVTSAPAPAGEHLLGLGVHYWKTVDDLADDRFDDVEEDGVSYLVSYQYLPRGIFRFEIDLEYYDDGFGGSTDSALAPVAYVVVGHGWYAGVGIGVTISDGLEDVSDPFYAGRIGWEVFLVPGVLLDVNANYRANAFSELDEADTDAITLAALVRFTL